jgi:CRISPR-associated exonuclease Cas4
MEYNEEDYLMLSGIQHFIFCRRQWALVHVEQQWKENERTISGELLHRRAHDGDIREKRGNVIIVRALRIKSTTMGISGECDVVEFHKSDQGICIPGEAGYWSLLPIEYKNGKAKPDESDVSQLCAQAMCLEEMYCTDIPRGAIFYGETRRREYVEFTSELRERVKSVVEEMHQVYQRGYTPKVRRKKYCNACSLKDICLPETEKKASVKDYLKKALEGNHG